ncbi:MAG TPA: ribulose-phosphate 3-epimerase [Bacteroidales bacterium]|nr:ribulose-phosphate 3-epimerase [Bacteroidales bacterium]HSA43869.1 ribulose-phosphate 3-epimerase [Bacteroidales bacterium]
MIIAPSILSADFSRLGSEIEMVNSSAAGLFHLDIMDGMFVPNISYGFPVMEAIKKIAAKPLDVHLMVMDPDRYLERFRDAGASWISVHYEACTHLHRSIQLLKKLEVKAGVALNPHTPVHLLEDILDDLDFVLIMSVNPGFGGQRFIERSLEKVRRLKSMILERNAKTLIEVDGGVDTGNAPLLKQAGVDILVAGNTVFRSADPVKTISDLAVCQEAPGTVK